MGLKNNLKGIYRMLRYLRKQCTMLSRIGEMAPNARLELPTHIENPQSVTLHANTKVRGDVHIINTPDERVVIKEYSVVAMGCWIVPGNHIKTVTVPQILLGNSHTNDQSDDLIINEDVWIGANAMLLHCKSIGRGAVVGAGSTVTRPVPPYAVVVGSPAHIVASTYDIEGIIKHEQALYPEDRRMTRTELESLFAEHYQGKKVWGVTSLPTAQQAQRIDEIKRIIGFVELK